MSCQKCMIHLIIIMMCFMGSDHVFSILVMYVWANFSKLVHICIFHFDMTTM